MTPRRHPLDHRCDANHCTTRVDAGKGMCAAHWQMLPRPMQVRIYRVARENPTRRQRLSSVEFLEAWADAVEHVARREGRLMGNTFRRLADLLRARDGTSGGARESIGLNIPDADDVATAITDKARSCEGKKAYRSYREAATAAKGLMRHTNESRAHLTPYGCGHCGQFHFGHAGASNRR